MTDYGGPRRFSSPPTAQELERAIEQLADLFRQVSGGVAPRVGVPLGIARGDVALQFGATQRIDTSASGTVRALLPSPDRKRTGSIVTVARLSALGTIRVVPTFDATVDGADVYEVPSDVGIYAFSYEGREWLSWRVAPGGGGGSGGSTGLPDSVLIFKSNDTYNVPAKGAWFRVHVVGAGGGGGGGAANGLGTAAASGSGGGGGGGGARRAEWLTREELLDLETAGGGSIAILVGTGGTGGAGAAVGVGGAAEGSVGSAGSGPSAFGPIYAYQGGGGSGGVQPGAARTGGGGGGQLTEGATTAVSSVVSDGGQPNAIQVNTTQPYPGNFGGGSGGGLGATVANRSGGCSAWGGGGGASGSGSGGLVPAGGTSIWGGGGGGSGGSRSNGGEAPGDGGAGGTSGAAGSTSGGGGAGGAGNTTGGAGTDGAQGVGGTGLWTRAGSGGGGGGGRRQNGGTGGKGGTGGFPGGGGGGGGCHIGTSSSACTGGAGGAGGNGVVVVEVYL